MRWLLTPTISWAAGLRLRSCGFAPGFDVAPGRAGTGILDVGADLEAIEVVCADDVLIPDGHGGPGAERSDQAGPAVRLARNEIRELLKRLVEQSLVSKHMTA
jgi:hypothetical protein